MTVIMTLRTALLNGASVGLAVGLALGVGSIMERHDFLLALPTNAPADAVTATMQQFGHWGAPLSRSEVTLGLHALGGLCVGLAGALALFLFPAGLGRRALALLPLSLIASTGVTLFAEWIWSRRGIPGGIDLAVMLWGGLLLWSFLIGGIVRWLSHKAGWAGWIVVALLISLGWGAAVWRADFPGVKTEAFASVESPRRVLLIGLDAASWANLEPSIEAGLMPTLAGLQNRGAWGELESSDPTWSPRIWTTIATGRRPEDHGILDFTKDGVPYSSNSRREWALWDLLPLYGARSAFHYWWASWPAEDVDGRIVTDRFQQFELDQRLSPEQEEVRLQAIFEAAQTRAEPRSQSLSGTPPDSVEEFEERHAIKLEVLDEFLLRDEFVTQLGLEAIEDGTFDLVSVYLRGMDAVGHKFWKWHYHQTAPRAADWVYGEPDSDQAVLGGVIQHMDVLVDQWLKRVLDAAGPDWNVIVVSDHGMRATVPTNQGREPETGTHHRSGMILMAGPDVKEDFVIRGANIYDVFPTILYLMGLPVATDLPGRILFEALQPSREILLAVRMVDAYPAREAKDHTPLRTDKDDGYLERLKALGYVVD